VPSFQIPVPSSQKPDARCQRDAPGGGTRPSGGVFSSQMTEARRGVSRDGFQIPASEGVFRGQMPVVRGGSDGSDGSWRGRGLGFAS
jgi:hypothetical protein